MAKKLAPVHDKFSSDWSWLYRDWRVWVIIFLFIVVIVFAVINNSGVVSKNKVVKVDGQQSQKQSIPLTSDAVSSVDGFVSLIYENMSFLFILILFAMLLGMFGLFRKRLIF